MKKLGIRVIGLIAAIAVLICGCNSTPAISDNGGDTVKWGFFCNKRFVPEESMEEKLQIFNEALRNNGYEFKVELVPIYYEDFGYYDSENACLDYEKALSELEEKNIGLDIMTAGIEGAIGLIGGRSFEGAWCNLAEQGFFEPLNIDNSVFKDLIPEKLWETVSFEGQVYAIPSVSVVDNFVGICYYLNSDYIDSETAENFDGSLNSLTNIVSDLSIPDIGFSCCGIDITYLLYNFNGGEYTNGCSSFDFDFQHSLILDYETMKAYNPFEYEPFIEWTRAVNKGVNNNLIFKNADYALINSGSRPKYEPEENGFKPVSIAYAGKAPEGTMEKVFCVDSDKMIEKALPAYAENQFDNAAIILSSSKNKENAFKLLEAIAANPELADAAQNADFGYIVGTKQAESLKKLEAEGKILVSPFAGYRICYKDVEEFVYLKAELQNFYSELCGAEDFDLKLAEIQKTLKNDGIDDFVDKVNDILTEKGF